MTTAKIAFDEENIEEMGEHAREACDLLKALAHETRLMILCLLVEGEKSVGELERLTLMRQPSVSQQLARLRFDRLVKTRRDGSHARAATFYCLYIRITLCVLRDWRWRIFHWRNAFIALFLLVGVTSADPPG